MGLLSEFFDLTKDRNADYQVKTTKNKRELTYRNPDITIVSR